MIYQRDTLNSSYKYVQFVSSLRSDVDAVVCVFASLRSQTSVRKALILVLSSFYVIFYHIQNHSGFRIFLDGFCYFITSG